MIGRIKKKLWVARKALLTRSSKRYYAQFAEDAIVGQMIDPHYRNGVFVDVGAYHPKKFSNTYALYKRGWRGINVDLDPIKIEAFRLARRADHSVCAAVSDRCTTVKVYAGRKYDLGATIDPDFARAAAGAVPIREVETTTLDAILKASPYADREIDLLSIDVEGHDYQVLTSIDLAKYKPKIVIVESNLKEMTEIIRSRMYQHLIKAEYRLVGWTHLSLIFRLPAGELFC